MLHKIQISHKVTALKISVLAALLILPAAPVRAQAVWNVASGNFNTDANWTPNGAPDSNTTAHINNGGTASVTSAASAGGLIIGNGTLTLADGIFLAPSLANTSDAFIGNQAGNLGFVNVNKGTWSNTGQLVVGFSGTGFMNITSNGVGANEAVSNTGSHIGFNPGSNGTVTVDGAGSTWTNFGNNFVGNAGTGTLTLKNGGQLNLNSGNGTLILANAAGSQGTLNIGNSGAAGTLNAAAITGGAGTATVNFDHNEAAYTFAPIISGSVSVNHIGIGTTILTGNNIYTGNTTVDGGTLRLQNGAKISNALGLVGASANSNGTVTVNGAGSTWTNTGSLIVGNQGTGTLNINNGGLVTAANSYIGANAGSNGTVTIDGAGSTWTNTSNLYVGGNGAGTLNIKNGGQVNLNSGNGVLVLATNAGSQGTINIGNSGAAGILNVAAILGFAGGTGTVNFNHNEAAYTFAPSISGSVSVNQIGSGITILTGNNTYTGLTAVVNGTLLVNNTSGTGTGVGAVNVVTLGTLGGFGVVDGNTAIAGTLKPGTLSDALHFNKNLTLGTSSATFMEIANFLFTETSTNIEVDGMFMIDGTLDVTFAGGNDLAYGDTFHLFTFNAGSLSGTFAQGITLPGLNDPGLSWDLSALYTTGTITVVPEPSTWTLTAFGLMGFLIVGFFRRRERA